jgi:hypothetical protein
MTLEQSLAEIESLKGALGLYANPDNWRAPPTPPGTYEAFPMRYFIAQYGEPQMAPGWLAASEALLKNPGGEPYNEGQ